MLLTVLHTVGQLSALGLRLGERAPQGLQVRLQRGDEGMQVGVEGGEEMQAVWVIRQGWLRLVHVVLLHIPVHRAFQGLDKVSLDEGLVTGRKLQEGISEDLPLQGRLGARFLVLLDEL